ncbi:MAG: M23 family metallopeptidase [Proteobacteria bacterium]|nr:M23 family metallopeptidase [Pseudomonadota bacterium]
MPTERWAQARGAVTKLFHERHVYVRSDGVMKKIVLTPQRQALFASVFAGTALWGLLATGGMALNAVALRAKDAEIVRTKAASERLVADRQARLTAAVAQLEAAEGGVGQLAETVENRHRALAMLLGEMQGKSGAAAKPVLPSVNDPILRVQAVSADQERLLDQAETVAKTRAERLRLAFRMAGINPSAFTPRGAALGGPLVEARDPRALAAVLDVDEDFARRIQRASADLVEMRTLAVAAERLPIQSPTGGYRTSSFGVRFDPFTTRPAFHAGVDFAGGTMSPVLATGPGVVSFAGVRSGYGNTVEVDHGAGLKTRYAHLHRIAVAAGQRVAVGQRLGGMGTTGRSTGVHLHYEVWVNGRVQNPDRFLKAGQNVQADA